MTKVLILDDDADVANGWCESISAATAGKATVNMVGKDDAAQQVEILLERQRTARTSGDLAKEPSVFDDVDVLMVDYDLVHISDGHGRFTGEGICRLAHAYSDCGFKVVLNQFVEADFDLSQRGNPSSSHADLNISSDHVANAGLWRENEWEEFRPWHWPILPDAAGRRNAFRDKLAENPTAKLLPLLGFTDDYARLLSDDAVGFFAPNYQKIEEVMSVTLNEFLKENSHVVDSRDGSALCDREVPYRFGLAANRITG